MEDYTGRENVKLSLPPRIPMRVPTLREESNMYGFWSTKEAYGLSMLMGAVLGTVVGLSQSEKLGGVINKIDGEIMRLAYEEPLARMSTLEEDARNYVLTPERMREEAEWLETNSLVFSDVANRMMGLKEKRAYADNFRKEKRDKYMMYGGLGGSLAGLVGMGLADGISWLRKKRRDYKMEVA